MLNILFMPLKHMLKFNPMKHIFLFVLTLFFISNVSSQKLQPTNFFTTDIGNYKAIIGCQTINNIKYYCNLYRGSFSFNGLFLDTNTSSSNQRVIICKQNANNTLLGFKTFKASNYIAYAPLLAHQNYLYLQLEFNDTITIDNILDSLKTLTIAVDSNGNGITDYYNNNE